MKTALTISAALAISILAGAAASRPAPTGDDLIAREGSGQRRTDLGAMELKPFPADLWSSLDSWTNGSALTAESTQGKVVLIATWKSFYPASHSALTASQRLAEAHAKDGLIVVAVHDAKGWENAAKVATEKKATVLMAHDNGKFREGLKIDQDPDFYLVDRAGNLRFADVETGDVSEAVKLLVGESKEQAAAVPTNKAQLASKAASEAAKSKTISEKLRPGQVLDVAFSMPEASTFKDAKWPEKNANGLSANDVQGNSLPAQLGNETWITAKPKTDGRVVVIDFWATWCGPCKRAMPKLDELQKKHRQDLVIMGISDEETSKVKGFLAEHKHVYAQAVDQKKTVSDALHVQGIPHVVVMSTDGIVRWQGNPLDENFIKAVESVMEADPGVKARRAAEAEYLKRNG
ncbi:MAG: redoxin family protein [Phycisphaerales bacterium]|nr:redoxin family protein [Phycisphaerales bacterium]